MKNNLFLSLASLLLLILTQHIFSIDRYNSSDFLDVSGDTYKQTCSDLCKKYGGAWTGGVGYYDGKYDYKFYDSYDKKNSLVVYTKYSSLKREGFTFSGNEGKGSYCSCNR